MGFLIGILKVEKCMARLQELQYTVAGVKKVISGVSLSPRSTRGYLRTSLRCKQESLRYAKIWVWFLFVLNHGKSLNFLFCILNLGAFQFEG